LQELEAVLLAAELDDHYGVLLDFIALLHHNAQLAAAIVANPQPMLDLLEDALLTAQVCACHHTKTDEQHASKYDRNFRQ
jgi:TorA maturation chaperone TorD